jgi:phosphatidylserine/phosphatidylglycerophosphate/cardiolipin synthase-like enzyme
LLLALLLVAPAGPAGQASTTPATDRAVQTPHIVSIYPNPVYPGDRGEFVVLSLPAENRSPTLTLTDGEDRVTVPTDRSGRLAVATEVAARNLTDVPVLVADGPLKLANAGEWVALRSDRRELDNVSYPQAPEGELYTETDDGWAWQRLGTTSFPVRRSESAAARLLVLPGAPEAVIEPLRDAQRRLWLAAYTFTSRRIVRVLCAASRRDVDVRVLVEREPVNGLSATSADRLDRLTACGASVQLIGGPRSRYAFHHAKYAIADDRAVVLTENWKPSGTGGRSNRGWGVVVRDERVADALAATFKADSSWRDTEPWSAVRAQHTLTRTAVPANGSYQGGATPVSASGLSVEVLLAPENAEDRVVELLDGATRSIRVIQVAVGGRNQPFVRALVRAARRGVRVRLLLADAWFVREQNRAMADRLNALAREADLPLRARLVTPRSRFGKIHAKGAVVDGEHVLVGSLNWNNASARENREVALLLHGEAAGAYYAAVFDADWQGGRWQVPIGLVAVTAVLVLAAAAFARRSMEFEVADAQRVRPVDRALQLIQSD